MSAAKALLEELSRLRMHKNVIYSRLSKVSGIHINTLRRMLSDRENTSLENFAKTCDALGVEIKLVDKFKEKEKDESKR